LVLILGLGAFAVALVISMPLRFAADMAGIKIAEVSGTLWDGQAKLDAGHLAIWDIAVQDSLLRRALVFDVQITGPQTRLDGRMAVHLSQVVVGPISGQAAWPLVAAVFPGLQIVCDGVADVHLGGLVLTRTTRSATGRVTVDKGFCDRVDGTVRRVPVPALITDIVTVDDGVEAVVTNESATLATVRITNDDRAQITIHAAGAALVPGMPSSADSQIDVPLNMLR
jgi:Type II secretion system (T2SS), protein N